MSGIEIVRESVKGKWGNSQAIEHCLKSQEHFNWLHSSTIKIEPRNCLKSQERFNWLHSSTIKTKPKYYERKISEPLAIKKAKCSDKNVLNRSIVKTNTRAHFSPRHSKRKQYKGFTSNITIFVL